MKKELKVKKHHERPDLTGEHPLGDIGQLVLLVVFLLVWAADIFLIDLSESEYLYIPNWITIPLGIIILISGFYFARKSLGIIFGIKRKQAEVVQDQVYNKVRHPMYLGALLFYLGVAVIMFSIPLLIMFIIIFFFYNFIACHEEKLLLNKFGEEYKQYMKKVRRWIPKF